MQTVKQKALARKILEGEPVLEYGKGGVSLDEVLARLRGMLFSSQSGYWSVSFEVCKEWEALLKTAHSALLAAAFSPDHEAEYALEQGTLLVSLNTLLSSLSSVHRQCRARCGTYSLCPQHVMELSLNLNTMDFCGR